MGRRSESMDSIVRHGRTVEEAVASAARELGVDASRLEVEVLDEGSRGFLGVLGQRESRVRVTVNPGKEARVEAVVDEILAHVNPDAEFSVDSDEQFISVRIEGDNLGLIIGRRGETLNALQYLVNVLCGRGTEDRRSVIIDAGDFRSRREEDLVGLARRMAERSIKSGRQVRLDPMPPHERKIAHLALHDDERVQTHSEGEDPARFVVIAPRE